MADRLTALDASFLFLERPGLPMHVAGLSLLDPSARSEGPVSLGDLRRLVAARIGRLPHFQERVHFGALGLQRPVWRAVPDVDLDRHLFHHELPPPGEVAQLARLCARIQERMLDRSRPLWQIHLIDGLVGGGQALVVKTHHSITDGIAGVEVAEVLFDRVERRPGARRSRSRAVPAALAGGPGFGAPGPSQAWLRSLQTALGCAELLAGGPITLGGPFNGRVGPHRAFALATVQLARVRSLKERLGGSVDDVLLAVVAAGLCRYLAHHGRADGTRSLRTMLPVSTRTAADRPQLGNRVTAVFLDLPVDCLDAAACLRRIAGAKSVLRSTHQGLGTAALVAAAGLLPGALHAAVVRTACNLPVANLIVSDIPGLAEPVSLLGARLVAAYPVMPLAPTVGISIAAVTMAGEMGLSVTSDPGLVPDPEVMIDHFEAALADAEAQVARRGGEEALTPSLPGSGEVAARSGGGRVSGGPPRGPSPAGADIGVPAGPAFGPFPSAARMDLPARPRAGRSATAIRASSRRTRRGLRSRPGSAG